MPNKPRYILPKHETLYGPHSKADLYVLVERGSLARGEIAVDQVTQRSHRVGDLIQGLNPSQATKSQQTRPVYRELSGDAPWEGPADAAHVEEEVPEEEPQADPLYDDLTEEEPADEEESWAEEEEEEETDPEKLLYFHAHPSWLSYSKWLFLSVLCVVAGILGIEHFSLGAVAVGIGTGSLILCGCIISRQHQEFLISGVRVEMEWGIFGRSSKEVRIIDIRSIDVHEDGVLGVLGVGTVEFSSSGSDGVEVQFKDVRYPHHVKELVRKLQALQK
jgi:hypothetical protein